MVGKFSNGKTAVANNEQITQGIKQAVIEGMMQVLSVSGNNGGNVNVNVTLEGDAKKMFTVTREEAKNYERRTGRPAFNF